MKSIICMLLPASLVMASLPCVALDKTEISSIQNNDSSIVQPDTIKKKKKLEDRIPKFVKTFISHATEYDSSYVVKFPYNTFVESRSSIDQEVLVVNTADNLHMKLASEVAFKTGPYIGYGPLTVGYLFRLNPTGRRSNMDFSINLNTNLFNVDWVYRRTGGDFNFRELSYPGDTGTMERIVNQTVGENISNDLYNTCMSINVNWIPFHKKFSNKAALSYGCQQIRSAGSPIFGLGYTFQKLETDMSMLTTIVGLSYVADNGGNTLYHTDSEFKALVDAVKGCKNVGEALPYIKQLVVKYKDDIIKPNNAILKKMLFNSIPTTTRVYDWHLQLGYAYNLVLSRHFMIGAQLIACPGIKRFAADNKESVALRMVENYDFVQKYLDKYDINPNMNVDQTSIGCDVKARLSVRWYNKHWYAGATGIFDGYFYSKNDLTMDYRYWTLTIQAGYNFNFSLKSLFKKKGHKENTL